MTEEKKPSQNDNQSSSERDEELLARLTSENYPFGRYEPLKLLGKGAAGSVYLSKDKTFDRKVALKTPHGLLAVHLFDFQQEARATSKLDHPHIIKIYDCGIADNDVPFIATEYFDGISLADFQKGKTIPIETSLVIYIKICEALKYAHKNGIFHRDLKPENILIKEINEDFELRVIDFGIAHISQKAQGSTLIQGKTIVGTPIYMSPDQVNERAYDERSEVYSLGCMLFETLTGVPPYDAESSLQLLSLHSQSPVPALSKRSGKFFPKEIEAIVSRCIEKNPEDRFQSMGEVIEALQSYLADPPRPEPDLIDNTPELASDTQRSEARKPRSIIFFYAILVFVFGGLVGYFVGKTDNKTSPDTKQINQQKPTKRLTADELPETLEKFGKQDVWKIKKDEKGETFHTAKIGATDKDLELLNFADFGLCQKVRVPHSNKMTGKGFEKLKDLPIRAIVINSRALTDRGIEAIASFETLKVLALVRAKNISIKSIKAIAANPEIEYLFIITSKLPPNTIAELSKMKRLRALGLSWNKLAGPKELNQFKELPYLEKLEISGLEFDNIDFLKNFTYLKTLQASHTSIDDSDLDYLADFGLIDLDLSYTNVSAKGLTKINKMKKLENLQLSLSNGITRNGIRRIIHLPKCIVNITRNK